MVQVNESSTRKHLIAVLFALALCLAAPSILSAAPNLYAAEVYADTTFIPKSLDVVYLGHGTVAWGDYDNDGDLDLLITGIGGRDSSNWDDASPHLSRIYGNDGGAFSDVQAGLTGVNNNEGTIWSDYDNDGDLDLFIGGGTHEPNADPVSKIYRNDGGVFVELNDHLPDLVGGAAWGDYDRDGDLDLFIFGSPDNGTTFSSKIYRNNHGRSFTDIEAPIAPVWGGSGAWGDYDNDGDLDLLLVGWGGGAIAKLYRNVDGTFVDSYASLTPLATGQAKWGDYDGDGDLDILMTGSHQTLLYRNDGSGNFSMVTTDFPGLSYSTQAWGDFDNDGDLDLVLSGQDATGVQISRIYRNDGGVFADLQADLVGLWYCSVNWGDYDDDGDLDLVMAGFQKSEGVWPYKPLTMLYENTLLSANQKPSAPPGAHHAMAGDTVTLSWNHAIDDKTPEEQLTYNIRIGARPLGEEIVAAESDPQSGYRKVPRAGNIGEDTSWSTIPALPGKYYWSVQAIDNVYGGSGFAAEDSFTIIGPTHTYKLARGWNLVSLPMHLLRPDITALFPTAGPDAFSYAGQYVPVTTLTPRLGYWINVPGASAASVMGEEILEDTLDVVAGWNLIGSISSALRVDSISSAPGGLVTSPFYTYETGAYALADTIEPGKGYWVKLQQPGKLVFSLTAAPASRITIRPTLERPPLPPGSEGASLPGIPVEFVLLQNYPNPFNPVTAIRYGLPERSRVRLEVLDVLGQQVGPQVTEVQDAGYHELRWTANVASGIYFCRIATAPVNAPDRTYIAVRKMMLVR